MPDCSSKRVIVRGGYLVLAGLTVARAAFAADKPLMSSFMGLNGHSINFDPADHRGLYSPVVGEVRDYHPVTWDMGTTTGGAPATNVQATFPVAKNGVNWGSIYQTWQTDGFNTNTCLQFDSIPQTGWANLATDAYNYGYRFASYFGSGTGGKKLVSSVEIGNEPGDYNDANYRTLFQNMVAGIRAADPKMTVVTCNATVGASTPYAKSLSVFSGLSQQPDVISIHTYPRNDNYTPTWKQSFPEDTAPGFNYLQNVRNTIAWRNANMPGKPIWVTEFGYDSVSTKPNDPNGPFPQWQGVSELKQAQYLTRSYLLLSAMSVERAYCYYFNDNDTPALFASSGITRNYVPKPSYWALAHLQSTLGDYRFQEVVRADANQAYVYSYVDGSDPSQVVWAIWSPTGTGRSVEMTLSGLVGTPLYAELMAQTGGAAQQQSFTYLGNGQIRMLVGESPTYLHISLVPEPTAAVCGLASVGYLLRRRSNRPR